MLRGSLLPGGTTARGPRYPARNHALSGGTDTGPTALRLHRRAALSAVAVKGADCPVNPTRQACLANPQAQLSATAAAGLPIGWGTVRDCTEPRAQCNWLDQRGVFSRHGNSGWQLMLVLIGFLVMIVALVPGARFWFGLLSRFGSIPATGPKSATAGRAALTLMRTVRRHNARANGRLASDRPGAGHQPGTQAQFQKRQFGVICLARQRCPRWPR